MKLFGRKNKQWNAKFYAWNHPAFGEYNILAKFEESDVKRLIEAFGEDMSQAKLGYYFIDSKAKKSRLCVFYSTLSADNTELSCRSAIN